MHFKGPVPRVGLSQEWACPKSGPVPRVGLSQEWACPKSGPVKKLIELTAPWSEIQEVARVHS
jgi:hypothetical protein